DFEAKLEPLRGGQRWWYDVDSGQGVRMATLYVAQGCPDWGERGGQRNELCSFCALPNAAKQYRDAFFDGRPPTPQEHFELFAENLRRLPHDIHTLAVFNAGSFLASLSNPPELQESIVRLVADHPSIQRLVIESRAELITTAAVHPLATALGNANKRLT